VKSHIQQSSFVAGQLDKQAQARSETALYRNGAAALRNCLLLASGGARSRWGTRDCGQVAVSTAHRIEEFSFSLEQSYAAVFANTRVDFYFASDGAPAGSVTGAPWTAAQVQELRFAQAGDVMWVAHPTFPLQVLRRTGVSSWTLAAMTFDPGGQPTFRYADPSITCTHAPANTLTFSAAWLVGGHVGTAMLVFDTTNNRYRYATIATVVSGTQCTVTWLDTAPPVSNVTPLWEEQAMSSVRGYARSVCLYQQRLIIGGVRDVGDLVMMSGAGRYFNFGRLATTDADPIALSLGTTRVRSILHAVAGPQLTFFTESAALFLPESDTRPLSPAALPKVRTIGPYGCGNVRPGPFDGGVLMVQSSGAAVRDLAYSNEADNLIADPVSLAATDFLGKIVDSAFMSGSEERPEQYAFFVTDDGRMLLFHSIREQRITAWAEWTTQGSYLAVGVAGNVLFAIVDRGGAGKRLERFDAGRAFDASVIDTRPFGALHFSGQTVHARLGDDYYGSGLADGSGTVTVTRELPETGGLEPGAEAEIGLSFEWWIDPLPPAIDLPDGTLAQRVQKMIRMGMRLDGAVSASVNAENLTLTMDGFEIDVVPTPLDGWWWAPMLGFARRGDDRQLTPRITRQVPMPIGVLAIKREVKV
jgi:hypothetical protein